MVYCVDIFVNWCEGGIHRIGVILLPRYFPFHHFDDEYVYGLCEFRDIN